MDADRMRPPVGEVPESARIGRRPGDGGRVDHRGQGATVGRPAELAACAPPTRLTAEELGNVGDVLSMDDPATKAALFASLGVTIIYDPSNRQMTAEARPLTACATARVGGGT